MNNSTEMCKTSRAMKILVQRILFAHCYHVKCSCQETFQTNDICIISSKASNLVFANLKTEYENNFSTCLLQNTHSNIKIVSSFEINFLIKQHFSLCSNHIKQNNRLHEGEFLCFHVVCSFIYDICCFIPALMLYDIELTLAKNIL